MGIDALVASAKKGKNAMPPMGTCMDCSDAELKAAIEFMLPK
jgi:cytochrome c5